MKKRAPKLLSIIMCFSLVCSILAGCTGNTAPSPAPAVTQQPAAGTTQQPGENPATPVKAAKTHPELNLRVSSDPNILDPYATATEYEYFISMQIFDSLVKFNGSDVMNILPSLAESWEISDDGTVYTLKLRDNVFFHSGDKMTADDVVYSVERFITGNFTKTKAPFVEGAEKVDDLTVNIKLKNAYPNFILQLASWPWRIVSKAAVEKYGEGMQDMVKNAGTGPYKLESMTPGVGVTLVSNKDYFEGEPNFEKINYKLIPDSTTAMTALLNGEIDLDLVTSGLDVEFVKNEKGFTVTPVERAGAYLMMINTTGVLKNEDFRKAIASAIDKKSFVDLVYDGQADPNCISILRPFEEGYSEDLPSYGFDLEKSKEYLKASGLPESEWKISLEIPATGVGPAFGATMKEMLSKAGITVDLAQIEFGAYGNHIGGGTYETDLIMYSGVGIPYNPPLVYNLYFKSTSFLNYFAGNRPGAVSIPEIDELGVAASKELDNAKRSDLFNQLHKIVNGHCLYIPIAYTRANYGHNEHLKGMEWEPGTLCTKIATWYWEE